MGPLDFPQDSWEQLTVPQFFKHNHDFLFNTSSFVILFAFRYPWGAAQIYTNMYAVQINKNCIFIIQSSFCMFIVQQRAYFSQRCRDCRGKVQMISKRYWEIKHVDDWTSRKREAGSCSSCSLTIARWVYTVLTHSQWLMLSDHPQMSLYCPYTQSAWWKWLWLAAFRSISWYIISPYVHHVKLHNHNFSCLWWLCEAFYVYGSVVQIWRYIIPCWIMTLIYVDSRGSLQAQWRKEIKKKIH